MRDTIKALYRNLFSREIRKILLVAEEKDVCKQEGFVYAYMCLIDWKYEVPDNFVGNRIFYSIDSLKKLRPCVEEDGIVKVKVSFVEVVQEEKKLEF